MKFCEQYLFLKKTTPYAKIFKIMFRKISSQRRWTLLCSNVIKFVQREIGEIVRYLLDRKKNKISPAAQTVATALIAPEICHGQSPTMYSDCCRFHPNMFTFGRVIAERVNTAKLSHKVNPIFRQSLASSQITIYPEQCSTVVHSW